MGEAKRRGTFEERRAAAEYTKEEIETATRVAQKARCSVKKALITLRKVRKQNDEMAKKFGYLRTENLVNGVAVFSNT